MQSETKQATKATTTKNTRHLKSTKKKMKKPFREILNDDGNWINWPMVCMRVDIYGKMIIIDHSGVYLCVLYGRNDCKRNRPTKKTKMEGNQQNTHTHKNNIWKY